MQLTEPEKSVILNSLKARHRYIDSQLTSLEEQDLSDSDEYIDLDHEFDQISALKHKLKEN